MSYKNSAWTLKSYLAKFYISIKHVGPNVSMKRRGVQLLLSRCNVNIQEKMV